MIRIVTEFSERKQKIEDELTSATKQIIKHICKIVLMPDNVSVNHWKGEIASFLYEIDKLKGKNKYPSYKQIMDWTYNKQKDMLTDIHKMKLILIDIAEEYRLKQFDVDKTIKSINEFSINYFSWIAKQLSNNGYVLRNSIYTELNELINKFCV